MPKRPTGSGEAVQYHQRIWDAIYSLAQIRSSGARTSRTTRGTVIEATPGAGGGTGTSKLQFKGQWSSSTTYLKDDVVIRALDSEIEDGNLIGTFIANQAIDAGAQEAAGEVPSFPLHENSKWDLFAIVPNQKFFLRAGEQLIKIIAGDAAGTTTAQLHLIQDRNLDIETGPRIILDLADCGETVIRVRPVPLCEVDVSTGVPTPGWRFFACSKFQPGNPPPDP